MAPGKRLFHSASMFVLCFILFNVPSPWQAVTPVSAATTPRLSTSTTSTTTYYSTEDSTTEDLTTRTGDPTTEYFTTEDFTTEDSTTYNWTTTTEDWTTTTEDWTTTTEDWTTTTEDWTTTTEDWTTTTEDWTTTTEDWTTTTEDWTTTTTDRTSTTSDRTSTTSHSTSTTTCSPNCVNQTCDTRDGRCIDCPPGKTWSLCDQECPPKTFGPRCVSQCSTSCRDQLCHSDDGTCIKCPAGMTGDYCDIEMCPGDFCKNGGKCAGLYSCDCSSTEFFGEMCQYTKEKIPVTNYGFLDIVNDTIVTTSGNNIKITGNVTLNKDGEEVSMAIPAGSYVTVDGPIRASCLDDIDNCKSGFSLTSGHSFSALDTTGSQVAMTTGAGLEDGVRGVSLYYRSGQVYSYVVTSTQEWSITQDFKLDVNTWYNMTVSWNADQGLALLQGSDMIGSSPTPSKLPVPANLSKPLTIGYPGVTSSAVMNVNGLTTVPVFWKEVQRSGILFVKTPPSEDSDENFVQILGIGIGSGAAVILAVAAVVIGVLTYRRKKRKEPKNLPARTAKDTDYITPSDHPYSMGSIKPYADYLNPVVPDNIPAPDYDYIGDDYLDLVEETSFRDETAPPIPVSNRDAEHVYSRNINFDKNVRSNYLGAMPAHISDTRRPFTTGSRIENASGRYGVNQNPNLGIGGEGNRGERFSTSEGWNRVGTGNRDGHDRYNRGLLYAPRGTIEDVSGGVRNVPAYY